MLGANERKESIWPSLPLAGWKDTCDTLHMWTQVIGKVKLELTPFLNQHWEVAFFLTARGMTTGVIPYDSMAFEVELDFVEHILKIRSSDGSVKALPLGPRTVADFYEEFMASLRALGIDVSINTRPVEVPDPIAFTDDRVHAAYDPEYVNRWWRVLVQTEMILQRYRSSFAGKSSPIQFYWGSFDTNQTRFSGKPAKPPEGAPRFVRLAENQENAACGFWPGNTTAAGVTLGQPAFYAYTYPEPAGYKEAAVRPSAAYYDHDLGEFILPYERVRESAAPEQEILDFFQSTYEAGAMLAGWPRSALEQKVV